MPLNSWWNSGSHQLVLKSLLYSKHIHPPIFFIGQIHLNFVIISTKSLKNVNSWEYQRKHSYHFNSNLALLEDAPAYEHFFHWILAKIFEWQLVVCQLKQKNLELSCLYMKGELLAIDKDSNKTFMYCSSIQYGLFILNYFKMLLLVELYRWRLCLRLYT